MPRPPHFDDMIAKFIVKHVSGKVHSCICPSHDDSKASLHITPGDDGKILMNCKAGCATPDVLAAVGLKMQDLFPTKPRDPVETYHKSPIIERYPYVDANGVTLYQVCRTEAKDFPQQSSDGRGGWNKGKGAMDGVTRLPYQLPRLLLAIAQDLPIYIVEGERDVATLKDLGCVGTCNSGGAGNWPDTVSPYFKGANVIILPDNDTPGSEHAMRVACSIYPHAASVRYAQLPGLPSKGDVSDWIIKQKHTKEELLEFVEGNAVKWTPGCVIAPFGAYNETSSTPTSGFPLTDPGNAERLIAAHGTDIRYNKDSGKWLVWNQRYWQPDHTGQVDRLAREVVRAMYDEIRDLAPRDAQNLFKHIQKSESRPRLEAMVALARHGPGIPTLSESLDSHAWLLNCTNGTLNLQTGMLRPHSQSDLITKAVPVEYHPEAECPRWHQFLAEVFQQDTELIGFVKRMVGYMLTANTREECLFILTGKGQNGKSKIVETLCAILADYAQDTPMTTLTERKEASSFDLPGLAGARLVTAAEGEGTQTFNEALLKRLTGGDPITENAGGH